MNPRRQAARRLLLRRFLAEQPIRSQEKLAVLLARQGHQVTQATISRDLAAIGAVKTRLPDGRDAYELRAPRDGRAARERLARMLREFARGIDTAANIVVIRTAPGAAQPVASAVDHSAPPGVAGTIAGDDTVLSVARTPDDAERLARSLESLMEE